MSNSSTRKQGPRPELRIPSTLSDSGIPLPGISDHTPGCTVQTAASEEPGHDSARDQLPSESSMQGRSNEETIITSISATDVADALGRLPAGFYAVVQHSGREWRTENKPVSVNIDDVEWGGLIPVPSDFSAIVCLRIYASFEFQPMLGNGEQLRELSTTVGQLLDHNASDLPFTFFSENGDIVFPCSSVLVTLKQQKRNISDSRVLDPHCPTTESQDQLEDATNDGQSALLRYKKYGEKRDLERSIERFEHALNICPLGHPCHAAALSNLAKAKFVRCQVDDIDPSFDAPLTLFRGALGVRPVGHPDRPSTLIRLAVVHWELFKKWRLEVDAAQIEALLHEAVDCSSAESHENRAAIFRLQLHAQHNTDPVRAGGQSLVEKEPASGLTDEDSLALGAQLLQRFERSNDLADLQQAISAFEASVRPASVSDHRYITGLMNLGLALLKRFMRLGELRDLEQAISRCKDAIELAPDDQVKSTCLHQLGLTLFFRFERLGELSDLEQAISNFKDAVDSIPEGHPDKGAYLDNLGDALRVRFERCGELSDLEQAISMLGGAVDLTPDGHSHKAAHLSNLGLSLIARFWRTCQLDDLQQAISMQMDAVNLTPDGHPHKPAYLNSLGISLKTRFLQLGEPSDLEQAISRLNDAVDLTPDGDPDKPCRVDNFGNALVTRFERFGKLIDLQEAISRLRDAAEITPDGHPHKPAHLNNLANSYAARFRRLNEPSDLDQQISRFQDAVDITPDGHPNKADYLNNLGCSFATRFRELGELIDLEQAISKERTAVDLTPDGHFRKHCHLSNLALFFAIRFWELGEPSDLEEAISRQRSVVDLTPDGHPHKPGHLNNLGLSFRTRFQHFEQLSDLEQAISMFEDAVGLIPDGHPNQSDQLDNLADCFRVRFEHLGKSSDLEQAISLYSQAACTCTGPTTIRFRASKKWISSARALPHHSLLRAYAVAIDLLPQLAWIGHSLTHRYRELVQGADVAREAAAAALDSGHPGTAVEWLEQGRSIIWGELFQLRSSYEELSSAHPDHARRLQELSSALEHAGAAREKSLSSLLEHIQYTEHHATHSLEQEADTHRTLAIERDELLQEIRGFPGFERFLLHKELSQLRASAHSGPVVILNAAKSRCDALIILTEKDNVVHVPFPTFAIKRFERLQSTLDSLLGSARVISCDDRAGKPASRQEFSWESILSSLWNGIVKPVLDTLGLSTPGNQTRIFWCPTGPFTSLPIHAAGLYGTQHSGPGHRVFDFVISSYVPTLSILMPPVRGTTSSSVFRILAVPQPPSDGQLRLPGVHTELEHIRAVIRNSRAQTTLLESSVGTVEEVLGLMNDADWVHFACHGVQDGRNPSNSGLCLADERRLKISDMISLSRRRGGLAFLSACQTAMGDKTLSDEAVHIAAGTLFAGYGSVVATMWSISDRVAPCVAKDVYEELFRTGARPDHREAARALHNAVGRLRDNDASFVEWVPFIHVGL